MLTPFEAAMLVALGLIPSIIWLLFYLREDRHPEPKSLLVKTFLMGIILSPLAILLQAGFVYLSSNFYISFFSAGSVQFYLWAALVEELVKFGAVRAVVMNNPEFDEPVDAMIYMITAALGFAAIENILVMFNIIPDGATTALSVWALRSAGATLLHALSSGLVGYFLALSWFFRPFRTRLIAIGITLATLFHFTFNFLLSSAENKITGLLYTTLLLVIMAFLISILFDKIKERHNSNLVEPIKT